MEFRIKRLVILILFFIVSSVSLYSKITKIKFVFTEERITVPVAVSCNPECFNWFNILNYKIIEDSSYMRKFEDMLITLEPDTINQYIDARIMAIISYDDTIQKDTLCFGEFNGIDFNGTLMQDNQELLKLVTLEVWPKNNFNSVNEEDSIKLTNIK